MLCNFMAKRDNMQSIQSILPALIAELKTEIRQIVKEEIQNAGSLPEFVTGSTAAAHILRVHGVNNPLSRRTINAYATSGRIPVHSRTGGRLIFKTADLIEWDRMGRPPAGEFFTEKV